MDYLAIIKKAYHITLRQPGLWLLGLFLAGGFSANFLYLAQIQIGWRDRWSIFQQVIPGFGFGPIAIFSAVTLVTFIIVVIVSNWAKVLFILHASDVLKLPRLNSAEGEENLDRSLGILFKHSLRYLLPVIAVSVLTMISVTIVTGILFGTPLLLYLHVDSQPVMWLLSAMVFVVLILFFSFLNIFSTFYIVLFRYSAQRAVNLALDLIVSKWKNIANMALMLIVIYAACFFIGSSLIYLLKEATSLVLLPLAKFGLFNEAPVINFLTLTSGVLLWVWLALVNVFFNLSLLLLFTELVKPTKHNELGTKKIPAPVAGI
jgi:hypothetical protein